MSDHRGKRIARTLATVIAAICVVAPAAQAATGDTLRTINAGGGGCSINVGLTLVPNASGELEGAMSCYDNSRIDFFKLSDGAFVRTIAVENGSQLGALAYDAVRGVMYGCNSFSQVIAIDPADGSSDPVTTVHSCFDGLAYDGTDDTLYASPDASCDFRRFTMAGVQLEANNVCQAPVSLPAGNSGIAVGGEDLYLGNNGGEAVYQVPRDYSGSTLFHKGDRRIEDLECDNTTFRADGYGAIWFQDAYDREVKALEIPADLCGSGGIAPIEGPENPGSCDDNIDNDGDGLIDEDDPACATPVDEIGVAVTKAGASTNVQKLRTFDLSSGAQLSEVNVSGLLNGEQLMGVDHRPATGQVIGFARTPREGNNTTRRTYSIDVETGVATPLAVMNNTPGQANTGVDVNPFVDRLRIVGTTDRNLRVNMDTGATTLDGAIKYAAGDPNAGKNADVAGSAYTNSVSPAPASTTLYALDIRNNVLATQAPPNDGVLNTVGSFAGTFTSNAGFDISGASGNAYASLTNGGTSKLYTVDLTTGALTLVGTIGDGAALEGMTVIPGSPPAA